MCSKLKSKRRFRSKKGYGRVSVSLVSLDAAFVPHGAK